MLILRAIEMLAIIRRFYQASGLQYRLFMARNVVISISI
jgi:hypothetical protein